MCPDVLPLPQAICTGLSLTLVSKGGHPGGRVAVSTGRNFLCCSRKPRPLSLDPLPSLVWVLPSGGHGKDTQTQVRVTGIWPDPSTMQGCSLGPTRFTVNAGPREMPSYGELGRMCPLPSSRPSWRGTTCEARLAQTTSPAWGRVTHPSPSSMPAE